MEQLNRLAAYFNERDRRRLDAKARESDSGFPEMSEEEIRLTCLENNGYETPELNDKLYLHFRGFKRIENLDKYTGCKSIWLDSNGFDKIENLTCLAELRCLYLSKNLIGQIEGLDSLKHLTILDLSNNRLSMLENLSCCPSLQTLNVSHNALSSVESIQHLTSCSSLSTLDLTSNRLPADEDIFTVLASMPALVTLSLNGNEVTKLANFRKRLIAKIGRLGYLDRPIDERERLCAEAYVAGGLEAEELARQDWKARQDAKRVKEMEDYKAWQAEHKRAREERRSATGGEAEEGGRVGAYPPPNPITEFTPEEQTQRKAEAEAAAEAERQMLAHGVGKLGEMFWKLEGKGAESRGGGVGGLVVQREEDLLERAAQELERQEKKRQQAAESAVDAGNYIKHHTEVAEEEEKVVEAVVGTEVKEEQATKVLPEEDANEPALESEAASPEDQEDEVEEVERGDPKEAVLRQQRVQDSMDIYLKQLKGQAKEPSHHASSTWEKIPPAPFVSEANKENGQDRPLYWSEQMDIQLAKLVVAYAYDFESIADQMQYCAKQGQLNSADVQRNPVLLSANVCKERWGALDASQWSSTPADYSPRDTVFRVNFPDEYLVGGEKGQWAQPSFDALQAMSSSRFPSYLKVPTAFPSVQDFEELD